MFDSLKMAPPDAILGLTEAFNRDQAADKINLGVGVFKDEHGKTPVLDCVKRAEATLLETETSKSYKPITGDPRYAELVAELLLGAQHPFSAAGRVRAAHCPGGTGALRVAGDFLNRHCGATRVWLSQPTWANHKAIFAAAGLETAHYPYFDAEQNRLDFEAMLVQLEQIPAGDVVLLHGCCHNPTGVDPDAEQWQAIARVVAERGIFPIVDFAYQGFGDGIEQDAGGLRTMVEQVPEAIVCSSFSKNFGLYCERTGAISIVARDADAAETVLSNIKLSIRANYSNPPAHGAAIVATILDTPELRTLWESELKAMRDRIQGMRRSFVAKLSEHGANIDSSFIERQRGMFSMSGLGKVHAEQLRREHSIYIVDSGRINVAGMTSSNIDKLCRGIAEVVGAHPLN